jgi:CRP/FNR family cyclic AMP-dependent transcriptional regulator
MTTDAEVRDALAATKLFGSVKPRALAKIAGTAHVVQHDAGKELASEGRDGVGFHLILEGEAAVTVRGASRPSLGPGDYFGEISLIDGKPRSASVVAETPLTTVSLVSWNFAPLLDEEPEITKALLFAMCERLRSSEQA